MREIILEALKLGLWKPLDVEFARILVKPYNNSLMLAIITLSSYINYGHVCLPLAMLTPNQLFFGLHIDLANRAYKKVGNLSIDNWEKLLFSTSIVSNGSCVAPLVLDCSKLYLYRMWKDECLIANFFHVMAQRTLNISEKKISRIIKLLDQIFPTISNDTCFIKRQQGESNDINWQKVAIVIALIRPITIISGGPGTGKTSVVAKFLIILSLLNFHSPLTIKMATPTGKSSAHLNESIYLMIKKLNLMDDNFKKYCLSVQAVTLHKLLGMRSNKRNRERIRRDFLFLDYLIIDESSMIDLSMMAKIVRYLSSKTKIVLLGDHKQLYSPEPGSIFSDICHFVGRGYTFEFSKQLKKITKYTIPVYEGKKCNIVDSLCVLNKNYRFDTLSDIGKLANFINSGNKKMSLSLLVSGLNKNIHYTTLQNYEDYLSMLVNCANGYLNYFKSIRFCDCKKLPYILSIFNKYRILCVLREGPFGVLQLNSLIESTLNDRGFIYISNNNRNYIGRPIIITSNNSSLSLFNGEIGIILSDNEKLFAYFLSSDRSVKKIPLHQLPNHETSFVTTVHKSQGSEFDGIALIFPNKVMPILTRELLYTGVTRARQYLSIYANDQVINYTVSNQCKRYSGLVDKLKKSIKLKN